MVSAAVAGDDLESVAVSASDALGRPVAIALPALGAPVVWPSQAASRRELQMLSEHAAAMIGGGGAKRPGVIADCVPIRIGHEVAGVVAALGAEPLHPAQRPWLEAAAAAAAVAALMRESQSSDLAGDRREFIAALAARPVRDVAAMLAQARRLGIDLAAGAVALCARRTNERTDPLPQHPAAFFAEVGNGRVLGLLPLAAQMAEDTAEAVAAELASRGMEVALSAPRRDPAAVHDALREAELMVELTASPAAILAGQEETYRLLIGVLLRDPEELEQLRTRTVAALAKYDTLHDTDLFATLRAFLAHHGSTTETAEAMSLHRHTVGYRLARVHEVSGLSAYESDGRERLSLGLKAHQILEAVQRRPQSE